MAAHPTLSFPILVPRPVSQPSFALLRQCYEDYRKDNAPCKGGAANQCAVRMSVALGRCGFGLERFPDSSRVHKPYRSCQLGIPHVLGAEELAGYLKLSLGTPIVFHKHALKDAESLLKRLHGHTGILYFNNCFKRDRTDASKKGDHIDLFDGQRCYNEILKTTPGGRSSSKTLSFFSASDRVDFYYLR
jgi:hypothetical protein